MWGLGIVSSSVPQYASNTSTHSPNCRFCPASDPAEIRVWSTARSLKELDTYAKVRIGGLDSHLLGLYRFLPQTISDGKKVPDLSLEGNSLKFLGGQRARFCQPMLDWKKSTESLGDQEKKEEKEGKEDGGDKHEHEDGGSRKRAREPGAGKEIEGKEEDDDAGESVIWHTDKDDLDGDELGAMGAYLGSRKMSRK